jgi:hypothetical protein
VARRRTGSPQRGSAVDIGGAKERLDRPDGTRAFIAGYRRCRPSCRQA